MPTDDGLTVLVLLLTWSLGSPPAEGQDAPVRGGTLVVAIVSDPGHLNPAITTSGATHAASELLYNGLLGRDERGEPSPELAESWPVEQGGAGLPVPAAGWGEVARRHALHGVGRQVHLRGGPAQVPCSDASLDGRGPRRHRSAGRPHRASFDSSSPTLRCCSSSTRPRRPSFARHLYQGTDPQTNAANGIQSGPVPFKFVSYREGHRDPPDPEPGPTSRRGCPTSMGS